MISCACCFCIQREEKSYNKKECLEDSPMASPVKMCKFVEQLVEITFYCQTSSIRKILKTTVMLLLHARCDEEQYNELLQTPVALNQCRHHKKNHTNKYLPQKLYMIVRQQQWCIHVDNNVTNLTLWEVDFPGLYVTLMDRYWLCITHYFTGTALFSQETLPNNDKRGTSSLGKITHSGSRLP